MTAANLEIAEADPTGVDALALLREAAIEARALYPDLHDPSAPWPMNEATPPGGVYLVAYLDGLPVACGALRPLEDGLVEVRRMFVRKTARRRGVGGRILGALEAAAARMGYRAMRLETGYRQLAAMGLYMQHGFARIEPFGEHVNDPTSVCFEKSVSAKT
jgi:GNAT superfamily N-acetyltransferase